MGETKILKIGFNTFYKNGIAVVNPLVILYAAVLHGDS